MTKRFMECGALVLLWLALAGCGGSGLFPPPAPAAPAEARMLAGEASLDLTYATFGPITGDLTGTEGTLSEQVAADCDTARWLRYWDALLAAPGASPMTATLGDVTATLTLAPLTADPAYQYALTLKLDGADVDAGQLYTHQTVLTGRLGADPAHPAVISLELTPTFGPTAKITVIHDTAQATRTIEVTTPRLHARTEQMLQANGSTAGAECAVYDRVDAGERLRRTMRFNAANNAAPEVTAGIRLACWVYDPAIGDPAQGNLCRRVLLKEDHSGTQRRYVPLLHAWQEETISLG